MATSPHVGHEERLAEYWRERSGLPFTTWDGLLGKKWPPGMRANRCEPLDREEMRKRKLSDVLDIICIHITRGLPLSFREFHLAVAFGFLLTDLDYETFYKTAWYENRQTIAYGQEPTEDAHGST